MILNSQLLSQKCFQCKSTSPRDCLWLPSNHTLKMIRHQLLYAMKREGSFHILTKFQSKVRTQSKYINRNSQLYLTDPSKLSFNTKYNTNLLHFIPSGRVIIEKPVNHKKVSHVYQICKQLAPKQMTFEIWPNTKENS